MSKKQGAPEGEVVETTAESPQLETTEAPAPSQDAPPLVGAAIVVPSGGLSFCAPDGRVLMALTENEEGARLDLYNPAGWPSASLQSRIGGAYLILNNGTHSAQINLSEAGAFFGTTEDDGGVQQVVLHPVDPTAGFYPPGGKVTLN